VGANFHIPSKTGVTTINVSVYNIYNHNNPFLVYTDYEYNETTMETEKKLMQVSIFPIIPSVSIGYKF
jgi:outer membrane protein W